MTELKPFQVATVDAVMAAFDRRRRSTADRPEAFQLCERWMARQTYRGSIQWIVADGGETPASCTRGP